MSWFLHHNLTAEPFRPQQKSTHCVSSESGQIPFEHLSALRSSGRRMSGSNMFESICPGPRFLWPLRSKMSENPIEDDQAFSMWDDLPQSSLWLG